MPHCIVEYSKELERQIHPSALMAAAYQGAVKSGLFAEENIKSRAIAYSIFQTGDKKPDFIHVTLRIFSGRTLEQRKALSHQVMAEFEVLPLPALTVTIDICEMVKETYTKKLIQA
jgi:5-carboxymethyl-2-hydroxymuconate isomerase